MLPLLATQPSDSTLLFIGRAVCDLALDFYPFQSQDESDGTRQDRNFNLDAMETGPTASLILRGCWRSAYVYTGIALVFNIMHNITNYISISGMPGKRSHDLSGRV